MTAFAIGLSATYVILGVLVLIRTLPIVVPMVGDSLLRPCRRRTVHERATRAGRQ